MYNQNQIDIILKYMVARYTTIDYANTYKKHIANWYGCTMHAFIVFITWALATTF